MFSVFQFHFILVVNAHRITHLLFLTMRVLRIRIVVRIVHLSVCLAYHHKLPLILIIDLTSRLMKRLMIETQDYSKLKDMVGTDRCSRRKLNVTIGRIMLHI